MLENFSEFTEYLKKSSTYFANKKIKKVIQDFTFILVSEKDEFTNYISNNQMIKQNIQISKVVIINKCNLLNKNTKDEFLILSIDDILNLHLIIHWIISNNSKLSVCFLKNTKLIFTEQFENPIIEYDQNFEKEIENFVTALQNIRKIYTFPIWSFISPCISGYLIKKSYLKISDDRIQSYQEFLNNRFSFKNLNEEDYIELRNLGIGLFKVQLIYHIERGELFALKGKNSEQDWNFELIEREKSNYEQIQHPYIPKFYGTAQNNDSIVIEFINGQTLDKYQFDECDINDIIIIIYKLLLIVNFIHDKHLLIRDIKPNNLMITGKNDIVMIDFDRIIDESTQAQTSDLNIEYAAPEVKTKLLYSYKSDIYSLGKMIEFIIAKSNVKDEITAINDIIKQCLQENADQRPSIKILFYNFLNLIISFKCLNRTKIISFILSYFSVSTNPQDQNYLGTIYKTGKYVERDINKAIYYYSLASNQNYPKAQNSLGNIFYTGEYVKRDINKAIYYLSLASNQNYSEAQFNLGAIYETGKYVERDINKAIYYYSLASNQNDPKAQNNLGGIYYTGKYVTRDINKAIYYYSLASKQNYSEAQFNLGFIYYTGEYVKRDINKAIYYFSLASNQNVLQAQFNLGNIYYSGKYIKRDINKAIYYYSLASKQNYSEAQYNLGFIYYTGEYVERDINKAIYYYSLASNQNVLQAQFNLGLIYYTGEYVKRDINKAIYYLSLASKQNHPQAQFILGTIYYTGKYVTRDINKAIYYYSLASKQNYPKAQNNLGTIYETGKYVERDINKAIYYYSLASKQNYSEAQFNLGLIFSRGEYVKRDINKAIYYYSLASDQNDPQAQFNLGTIYYTGDNVERDINKAIYYYSLASNQNHPHALFNLGLIYYTGEYVKRDINKAIYYYSLASNQNVPVAQFCLGIIYYGGLYCKKDINKGQQYIMLSSYNGYRLANFTHGFLLHKEKKIIEAIHYYKEASSFNIQFAKNNLGIIYKHGYGKEIPKRIGDSIVYFEEAILQKNDILSMYNLAHIHIYEDTIKRDIDKSIDLLIKSSKKFKNSSILLCVVLIKRFGFNNEIIKREIDKRIEKTNELYEEISTMTNLLIKSGESYVDYFYETYRNMDFLYDALFQSIRSSDLHQENTEKERDPNLKDISEDFYEGFGYGLINNNSKS